MFFTFTNTGEEPLIIIDAKGSCGCTVPKWPKAPIAPGETASLTVEFNTKGKRGQQVKKVTLTANTNPPQTYLYVKGEVQISDQQDVKLDEDETLIMPERDPDCFAIFPNPTAEVLRLEMKEDYFGQSAVVTILKRCRPNHGAPRN